MAKKVSTKKQKNKTEERVAAASDSASGFSSHLFRKGSLFRLRIVMAESTPYLEAASIRDRAFAMHASHLKDLVHLHMLTSVEGDRKKEVHFFSDKKDSKEFDPETLL